MSFIRYIYQLAGKYFNYCFFFLVYYMNLGQHVFLDLNNCNLEPVESVANAIFNLMISTINNHTNMKIVHSHIEIFDKNPNTLDGWTSCLLLDASHFTSHCYSDKGLISFDLFTCGSTNTLLIMNIFLEDLKKIINFNSSKIQYHKRFIY